MVEKEISRLSVVRLAGGSKSSIEDILAREFPLTIILNNEELVTLLCSPADLRYLAIGFLASEGLLGSKKEVKKMIVDEQRGVVRVDTEGDREFADGIAFKRFITSGCGRGASFYRAADADSQKVQSQMEISADEIFALTNQFQHQSQIYRATGGVHSAALCDNTTILVFNEDIGRHNAIDKVFGQCLLEGIPMAERIIITSGRISSEILLKVAKRNIPIIISKAAPTDLGVRLADDLSITLVGFVRGRRMNVYAHDWRIK